MDKPKDLLHSIQEMVYQNKENKPKPSSPSSGSNGWFSGDSYLAWILVVAIVGLVFVGMSHNKSADKPYIAPNNRRSSSKIDDGYIPKEQTYSRFKRGAFPAN